MRNKKQLQARGRAAAIDVCLDETTLFNRGVIKDIYDKYLQYDVSDSVLMRRAIHTLHALTLRKLRKIQRMKDPVEQAAKLKAFIKGETELLKYAACRFDFVEVNKPLTDDELIEFCKSVGIDI